MDFFNNFKKVKKMSKNIYEDFELAWAEYEYICTVVRSKIFEIIDEDPIVKREDDSYVDVKLEDAVIIILVKPGILTSTLRKIEVFLGLEGQIRAIGKGNRLNYRFFLKIFLWMMSKNSFENFIYWFD